MVCEKARETLLRLSLTSAVVPSVPVYAFNASDVSEVGHHKRLELPTVDCLECILLQVGLHEAFKDLFAAHQLQIRAVYSNMQGSLWCRLLDCH